MEQTQDYRGLMRAIVATQFAPPFMISGVAVILPAMGSDLGARATSLGLVETLFLGSQLSFLLTAGRLADASDKRTLYKLGLACFAASSLLIALLSSVPGILLLRFMQGMSAAVFLATGPAILSEIVPPERRGRAFGSSIGAIYSGFTLGPLVAGFLSDRWGWRAVFVMGAGLTTAACLMISLMMPSRWRKPVQNIVHIPSATLIVSAVLTLIAGSVTLRERRIGYALMAVAAVLMVGFVRLQLRLDRPLIDLRALMANRILGKALLIQLLIYVTAFATVFLSSLYMQVSLGASASLSGQLIAVSSLVMALLAPVAGWLSDRCQPRRVLILGVLFALISATMGVFVHKGSGLVFISVLLTIQSVGFAFFSTPNMTIIIGSMPPISNTVASALGAKARTLGMMSGMLLSTLLISLNFGNAPVSNHPERLVGTMVTAFSILAAVTTASLVLAVWPETPGEEQA